MWKLFQPRISNDAAADAAALYAAVMTQSRRPVFFTRLGVPDTVDGRFDLLTLHAALVMRRLRADGGPGHVFAQALFDRMFRDMERAVREMGVGDLGVSKHMKRMIKAFYGRAQAYEAALDADGPVLQEALTRNLYGTVAPPAEPVLAGMAAYAAAAARLLDGQGMEALAAGRAQWPDIDDNEPQYGT